jgi:hypothetical protein
VDSSTTPLRQRLINLGYDANLVSQLFNSSEPGPTSTQPKTSGPARRQQPAAAGSSSPLPPQTSGPARRQQPAAAGSSSPLPPQSSGPARRQQPAAAGSVSENNEDFYLVVADGKSKFCNYCERDILYKSVDRHVFKHNERYTYPLAKDGKKWLQTALTKCKTLPVYYHARSDCIYSKFRRCYFDSMPLHIHHDLNLDGEDFSAFTHPKLAVL